MKSFKNFLFEENKIKPVGKSEKIPKKLPPKPSKEQKKPEKSENSGESPTKTQDSFEKSRNIGPGPYSGKKK